MNHHDLTLAFFAAAPGTAIEYYRGHLARDRESQTNRRSDVDNAKRIRELANMAYDLYVHGWAELIQRWHGPHDASYFIIKRNDRRKLIP